ncbi:MAG: GNAT family N-acetyltransferase [Actinomycetota bacterium]
MRIPLIGSKPRALTRIRQDVRTEIDEGTPMLAAAAADLPGGLRLRRYEPSDLAEVYDVCVRTAYSGGDARGRYDTDDLMGDLFAGPYLYLEPGLSFVLEDDGHVVGYVLAAADTERFAAAYRETWIPRLADRYPPLDGPAATETEQMIEIHYHPEGMVRPVLADHPAHLHIDLLPEYQRRGLGKLMIDTMFAALAEAGVPAVYVAMLTSNEPARAFYDRLGFYELTVPDPGELTFLGHRTQPA